MIGHSMIMSHMIGHSGQTDTFDMAWHWPPDMQPCHCNHNGPGPHPPSPAKNKVNLGRTLCQPEVVWQTHVGEGNHQVGALRLHGGGGRERDGGSGPGGAAPTRCLAGSAPWLCWPASWPACWQPDPGALVKIHGLSSKAGADDSLATPACMQPGGGGAVQKAGRGPAAAARTRSSVASRLPSATKSR